MNALVTGGGGFLGGQIARLLLERGDRVTILGRGQYPQFGADVRTCRADVREAQAVADACRGQDVVFHVAAKTGIWGPTKEFWQINADGTRNVIAGCRGHGVPRLVYTSSPSVVFGKDDLCGVDESQPYPKRYLAAYPASKAAAEQAVLAANGPDLATVALRPHLIWGPGDPHLIPRVIERARSGRLVQVGDGDNLVDITYIDNAAEAHLRAADALQPSAVGAGRPFFISQGEAVNLWSWLGELLNALGIPRPKRAISFRTAFRAGAAMEMLYKSLRMRSEPRMTRFLASQLAKSHFFCVDAARRDFGYRPAVTTQMGVDRLLEWLRSMARP